MAQKNLQVVGDHIDFRRGIHGRIFGSSVLSLLAKQNFTDRVWQSADGGLERW